MTRPSHPEVLPEVLVVGAGAAGLTLAIDLARRNVAFRLIDKAAHPFAGSRGKGIQPRSQEVFEDLGVLDRIAALGGFYPLIRRYTAEGFVEAPFVESQPASSTIPYDRPLMLSQNLTEGALRARLAELGARPEFGCALEGFDQDEEGVTARIGTPRGEETMSVRFLVGADGGGSLVRRTLGIGFPGETLPARGLVADLALTGLGREVWHFWTAGGPAEGIHLCPLAGTDLFQLQTGLPLEGEPDLSDRGIADLIARRTGRADIAVGTIHWRSAYGMNARLADAYRSGRVFLAGDAAHAHPPTGGQGLNTSVQDAYALGWRLGAVLRGAPEALLDTYEAERRPIAVEVLAHTTALMRATREGGGMRRGREFHELDLGYFDSPLALERRRPGRLRAGARAPDAPCRGAAGQPTRLFEVFRGPQWTLLGYDVAAAHVPLEPRRGLSFRSVGKRGDLLDPDGAIAEAYDLDPGDYVLIRPDGYVGAMVSAGEEAALPAYLDRVGLSAVPPPSGRKSL
ncbi:MAG: monooxygenase FAD-binding [Caulobacteraceae bacterium]|nr:monooxygenase FAD-binding [Caulobacteraceae bacterium]